MIPLALEEVGALGPGRLDAAPWADEVTGVQIDSRRIEEGDLFFAVGGGEDFCRHAFARGAAATLVPEDAFAELAALGSAVRARSSARVVGITGSTGKTSTKDILAALCRPHARTVAAEEGHNNEIGLPLTLTRIEPDTEVVVCEMGMRGLGQIAELCAIARPDVGVITSIGPVHLELLGTVERVAEAKAEVVASLPEGGVAVVPDEPLLEPFLRRDDIQIRRFDPDEVTSFELVDQGARVGFALGDGEIDLEFPFTARYQAQNALVALYAYIALGLPLDKAQAGAGEVTLSRWRGEETELPGGGLLINDSYNANPDSMIAALAHLSERAGDRRRVAILGDMAELGPEGPAHHSLVSSSSQAVAGLDALLAVGELAREYLVGPVPIKKWAANAEDAIVAAKELVRPGDVVLVKGSRAVGLEIVAEALTGVPA
ncbi:MAG TPA: UDP-N-acetylmuramoyl-tripeptide--D-alanyl-D-alanine ligase [Gaiellaceae bacterium]|nr:UDP-N-acetylmuramoyl-tripeptide--D-alanyl-D-alanine ligase [Gaiellaceae bacterium]